MEGSAFYYDFGVVFLKKTYSSKNISIKNFHGNFSKPNTFEEIIFQYKNFRKKF